jgi:hypothetical protein
MSSSLRTRASNKRGEQFFTNTVQLASTDFLDSTGTTLATSSTAATPAAFSLLLRDMGTQVTIPGDYTTGATRRVLRKVQLIAPNAASAATVTSNYNEGVTGVVTGTALSAQGNVTQPGYGAFYIEIGGILAAGAKFVSITVPGL